MLSVKQGGIKYHSRFRRIAYAHSMSLGWDTTRSAVSVHGSGRVCSGSADNRSRFALASILKPRGGGLSPQTLTLLGGAMFIAWRLRRLFLRWMPMWGEAFLEMLGVSWLQLCARTHLKKVLCHTRPVGGTEDKYRTPSIRLFHISSIANECILFSFSFNNYLYKSIVGIQLSFRSSYFDHDNTTLVSCLLSELRLNILGLLFLSNPNLLLSPLLFPLPLGLFSFSFSTVIKGTLFIYLFSQLYFSLSTIQNRVHRFCGGYHETRQDFAHILRNIPSPFSKISSSTQWSSLLQNSQNFRPHSRGTSQNACLATNQYLKILDPSLGKDLQKTWYGFDLYPKNRSQFPQLFQTPNPSHKHNYGSKGIWAFSWRHIVDAQILPGLGIERHTEKYFLKVTTFNDEYFRITLNFIHKKISMYKYVTENTTTSRVSLWQIDKLTYPFFTISFSLLLSFPSWFNIP